MSEDNKGKGILWEMENNPPKKCEILTWDKFIEWYRNYLWENVETEDILKLNKTKPE